MSSAVLNLSHVSHLSHLTVLFDCRSSEETDLHGQHASLSDVSADRQEGETEHCSLSQ